MCSVSVVAVHSWGMYKSMVAHCERVRLHVMPFWTGQRLSGLEQFCTIWGRSVLEWPAKVTTPERTGASQQFIYTVSCGLHGMALCCCMCQRCIILNDIGPSRASLCKCPSVVLLQMQSPKSRASPSALWKAKESPAQSDTWLP